MIFALALKSLRNRTLSVSLTVLSIALSVLLLLGVERVRDEARGSFSATVSGTDLIVGARTSPVHLLLYAVFHVGYANNNLRWESYRAIAARPAVAWTIPLSMGDSHRGFRVVGTDAAFFRHFRHGQDQALGLALGAAFAGDRDAVLGADVARRLGYKPGDPLVLAHGAGDVSFVQHDAHPFRVSGVLARTGTPVDRAIYVDLRGISEIHEEETSSQPMDPLQGALRKGGRDPDHRSAQTPGHESAIHGHTPGVDARNTKSHPPGGHGALTHDDEPQAGHDADQSEPALTAVLVGLKSRASALGAQRDINAYAGEPLTALMPGPTLQEIWEILGAMEKTLFAVSALVVLVGLAGMLVALLTSLNERRREMAILRAVGARPGHVFALILGEAAFITAAGIVIGLVALYAGLWLGGPWLETRVGLFIPWRWPSPHEIALMAMVAVAGVLIGLIPAYRSYRRSLADGMTIRV